MGQLVKRNHASRNAIQNQPNLSLTLINKIINRIQGVPMVDRTKWLPFTIRTDRYCRIVLFRNLQQKLEELRAYEWQIAGDEYDAISGGVGKSGAYRLERTYSDVSVPEHWITKFLVLRIVGDDSDSGR